MTKPSFSQLVKWPIQRVGASGSVLLLILHSFLLGCSNHGKPEKAAAPLKSRFVRTEVAMPNSEKRYPVWITRSPGEPILLLHALNGISPETLLFALEMEMWGYRIYLPSLYGDSVDGRDTFGFSEGYLMSKKLKRHPDWRLLDADDPGMILDDVAEMSRWVARREAGRHLTVMGNSLTGNFPLALLDQPAVKTAVVSQPALPVMRNYQVLLGIPQTPNRGKSLAVPDADFERSFEAMKSDPEKRIIGFHYRHDPIAPIAKFDLLARALEKEGLENRFTAYVLDSHGDTYARQRPWVVSGQTEECRKMLTPHSTLINPENRKDRDWFRARLREVLE